ncbi:MAG: 16S rRNA (cytidine(1402)-2'-O)-methyltransferase [Malacoplasma sp.]
MKKLFIIATPIGNINEVSLLAIEKLKTISLFFCEDTRVSKKLFNLLNISIKDKKFIAINSFNENNIIDNLNWNLFDECALLSDAGYPTISDPGFYLISNCIKKSVEISIINGPCSIIHALVGSGFPSNSFYFIGFLSKKKNLKQKELLATKNMNTTIVIFESIHKILDTLMVISKIFPNNEICIAKELSKRNEKFYYAKGIDVVNLSFELKGEFIIIINNNNTDQSNSPISNDLVNEEILYLINQGNSDKMACKIVAYKYDLKPNTLFKHLQNYKNNVK